MLAGTTVLALIAVAIATFSFLGGNEPASADAAPVTAASSPAPEIKLSKREQFIREADQICAGVMTGLQKLPTPTNLEEAVKYMEMVQQILVDARRQGLELDVPRDAHQGWAHMIGTKRYMAEFDDVIAALTKGDVSAVGRWEAKNEKYGARDMRWAKRYGMAVCSQELG